MKHQRRNCLSSYAGLLLACPLIFGSASAQELPINKDMLAEVQSQYGLERNAAIERLARELEAAEQNKFVESLGLEGYAGAWFDGKTQRLHVATNRQDEMKRLERLGVMPVKVDNNLATLNQAPSRVQRISERR